MKKLAILAGTLLALAALLSASVVYAAGPPVTGKPIDVNPKTMVIIDYVDSQDSQGANKGRGKGPPGGGGDEPDHRFGHYELIGGVWADNTPGNEVVDPGLVFKVDLRGFPDGSKDAILQSFSAWEAETQGVLLGGISFVDVNVAFGDGVNTYSMRNLGGRVLAATYITWDDGDDDGKINAGEPFLEMDVVHNVTVKWAIAPQGVSGKWFDVQNVAVHEIGHVYGLGHPGNAHSEDNEQTMYASAAPKETKKRTLESNGDIPGINDDFLGY